MAATRRLHRQTTRSGTTGPPPPSPCSAWAPCSLVAAAVSGTGRALPGFFGTNARLLNDLNLVLQLMMAASLVLGVVLVRRRNYRAHQLIMTTVVVVNLVAIAFVMGTAFVDQVLPAPAPGAEAQRLSPMLHGIAGSLAEALGLYLLLRMYELLPAALRVANYKLLMRLTFGLWLLVAAGGVSLYLTTYAGSATLARPGGRPAGGPTAQPAAPGRRRLRRLRRPRPGPGCPKQRLRRAGRRADGRRVRWGLRRLRGHGAQAGAQAAPTVAARGPRRGGRRQRAPRPPRLPPPWRSHSTSTWPTSPSAPGSSRSRRGRR